MSNLKRKFGRRILAYILSGAMILSSVTVSGNMTAFASEPSQDTGGGTVMSRQQMRMTPETGRRQHLLKKCRKMKGMI